MHKRNIYIFLVFVSLSTGLFGETLKSNSPTLFRTRWFFLGTTSETFFSAVKDSSFERAIQTGVGANIFAGVDLFSVFSVRTDLEFLKVNASYPNSGIIYRGYTAASNNFRLDIYLNWLDKEQSNLNMLTGLFGGWGYSFASYTQTPLIFYYTQIFGGPRLEIFDKKHNFYSFTLELPLTYQFRRDLEYSTSLGISIGLNLYPLGGR